MALCAARAQALGGGLVVARDGAVARRARAADRRAALRRAARGGRRGARAPAGPAGRAGRRDRRAVHDALVPRAVGDPVAEDHRPRAGRRRRLRARPARARTGRSRSTATRSWRASARSTSTRRGSPRSAWRPDGFDGIEELDARAAGGDVRGAARTRKLALIRAHPDLGEKVGVAHRALARASRPGSASTASPPPSTSASWPPTPPTRRSSGSRS